MGLNAKEKDIVAAAKASSLLQQKWHAAYTEGVLANRKRSEASDRVAKLIANAGTDGEILAAAMEEGRLRVLADAAEQEQRRIWREQQPVDELLATLIADMAS